MTAFPFRKSLNRSPWWPGVVRDRTSAAFIQALAAVGYGPCPDMLQTAGLATVFRRSESEAGSPLVPAALARHTVRIIPGSDTARGAASTAGMIACSAGR